VAAIPAL
jgi:hypothetical protein